MPHRQYLEASRIRANPVVDLITNPVEVESPDAPKVRVGNGSTDVGLFPKQANRASKILAKGIRRLGPVRIPPGDRFANLVPRSADDPKRKRSRHSR
jgi:hypothetical protein